MIDHIFHLNYKLFVFINRLLVNDFLDFICPLLRNKYFWAPLYVFLITFLIINFRRKGLLLVVFMIGVVALTDPISSKVLKPYFEILRPCQDPVMHEVTRLLVSCPHSFSLPSSHASNHFALAFFFTFIFLNKAKWIFPLSFLWASVISFSQIYVGVHYPLDIFAGMILGLITGLLMAIIAKRIFQEYPNYFIHQKKHLL